MLLRRLSALLLLLLLSPCLVGQSEQASIVLNRVLPGQAFFPGVAGFDSLLFSADNRRVYLADGQGIRSWVLERRTVQPLTALGGGLALAVLTDGTGYLFSEDGPLSLRLSPDRVAEIAAAVVRLGGIDGGAEERGRSRSYRLSTTIGAPDSVRISFDRDGQQIDFVYEDGSQALPPLELPRQSGPYAEPQFLGNGTVFLKNDSWGILAVAVPPSLRPNGTAPDNRHTHDFLAVGTQSQVVEQLLTRPEDFGRLLESLSRSSQGSAALRQNAVLRIIYHPITHGVAVPRDIRLESLRLFGQLDASQSVLAFLLDMLQYEYDPAIAAGVLDLVGTRFWPLLAQKRAAIGAYFAKNASQLGQEAVVAFLDVYESMTGLLPRDVLDTLFPSAAWQIILDRGISRSLADRIRAR